jgi:hypothetical protein
MNNLDKAKKMGVSESGYLYAQKCGAKFDDILFAHENRINLFNFGSAFSFLNPKATEKDIFRERILDAKSNNCDIKIYAYNLSIGKDHKTCMKLSK